MDEEEIDPGTVEVKTDKFCYCNGDKDSNMLQCLVCKKHFHSGCLKSGRPSPLAGDVYFCLTCKSCSQDDQETCLRTNISWMQAVYLALYNLALAGSGRKGFFRWKEDICQFIERNWTLLFPNKKRSTSWCSTIAGTLSVGCPRYFKSGQQEFKEPGWWALKENAPPAERVSSPGGDPKKRKNQYRKGGSKRKTPQKELSLKEETSIPAICNDSTSKSPVFIKKEQDNMSIESLLTSDGTYLDVNNTDFVMEELNEEQKRNLDETFAKPSAFVEMEDPCTFIRSTNLDEHSSSSSSDEEMSDQGERRSTPDTQSYMLDSQLDLHSMERCQDSTDQARLSEEPSQDVSTSNKSSRSKKHAEPGAKPVAQENRIVSVSEVQEHEMLCRLNACPKTVQSNPQARRLRRKLLLRKLKRDRVLPVFDPDVIVSQSLLRTSAYIVEGEEVVPLKVDRKDGNGNALGTIKKSLTSSVPCFARSNRVLDRYMAAPQMLRGHRVPTSTSFRRLLVGSEQQAHMRPFTSPYTARILKPYIRRDFESQPLKLKLMNELLEVTHKLDAEWQRPEPFPIDYCYVQPHHIPAVNAMCREFFWPGIDLSECLQYPDFSCVVLYRNYVIAFAFMVPDVKYNEAYISFVLVHPEWRRAGIGRYMLYHLIQTCLGKDVTLHVSITNPALLLYQRFGFKPEEFILDFYDRYLPESSPECRHAFFLRLRR